MNRSLKAAAAAAVGIGFMFTPSVAQADPAADCVGLSGYYLQRCLRIYSNPGNPNGDPAAGMTPEQLKECCLSGKCVDGGIDPANYKTIVCDPARPIPPGSEGF